MEQLYFLQQQQEKEENKMISSPPKDVAAQMDTIMKVRTLVALVKTHLTKLYQCVDFELLTILFLSICVKLQKNDVIWNVSMHK